MHQTFQPHTVHVLNVDPDIKSDKIPISKERSCTKRRHISEPIQFDEKV